MDEYLDKDPYNVEKRAEWFPCVCYQELKKETSVMTTDYDNDGCVTDDDLEQAFLLQENTPLELLRMCRKVFENILNGKEPNMLEVDRLYRACNGWEEMNFFVEKA